MQKKAIERSNELTNMGGQNLHFGVITKNLSFIGKH